MDSQSTRVVFTYSFNVRTDMYEQFQQWAQKSGLPFWPSNADKGVKLYLNTRGRQLSVDILNLLDGVPNLFAVSSSVVLDSIESLKTILESQEFQQTQTELKKFVDGDITYSIMDEVYSFSV